MELSKFRLVFFFNMLSGFFCCKQGRGNQSNQTLLQSRMNMNIIPGANLRGGMGDLFSMPVGSMGKLLKHCEPWFTVVWIKVMFINQWHVWIPVEVDRFSKYLRGCLGRKIHVSNPSFSYQQGVPLVLVLVSYRWTPSRLCHNPTITEWTGIDSMALTQVR